MPVGVLNSDQIRAIIDERVLKSDSKITPDLKPEDSAIDAPLGEYMYEMKGSRRPNAEQAVLDVISDYKKGERISLSRKTPTVLKKGSVYLIKLKWSVALPPGLCIRATAKSSIGRLDTLVRLVADRESEFDRVSAGRTAELYVEVAPLTFSIQVKPDLALSQIRFMRGNEEWCTVPHGALMAPFEEPPVLVMPRSTALEDSHGDPAGVLLSLNLEPEETTGFVGYCAKNDIVEVIDPAKKEGYDPREFWEPLTAGPGRTMTIEKDRFYIFRSVERFRVPDHLCVDCQAYSEALGDIRIHYAGFAHPFFGDGHPKNGAPLIFEVRGHSVDTFLRHGDSLAKVYFRRMSKPANKPTKPSVYSNQELKLSVCFKDWPVTR
jgi:dCTP deaminase